jgi:hypothetical protein
MVGLLFPVMCAIGLGVATGGSLDGWSEVRPRWWQAAVASLLVLLVLYDPPLDRQPWAIEWGPWVSAATLAILIAVLLRNVAGASTRGVRVAFALAALGVASNLTVVLANDGYMPQSTEAYRAVWGTERVAQQGKPTQLKNTSVMNADSRLAFLADVIPQPAWLPKANVISVGDLMLSTGLACWALQVTIMRRRSGPRQVEAL